MQYICERQSVVKRKIILLYLLVVGAVLGGCSAGQNYWQNRCDDAADIFTCTAGSGFGIKAYVCGLQVSCYNYAPTVGLQGGEFFQSPAKHGENYHINEGNIGIPFFFADSEIFYPGIRAAERGKAYCGLTPLLPFFILSSDSVSKSFCNSCAWDLKGMHRRALQQYITSTPEDRQFYQQHQNDEQCGGMKDLFFQKPHWSVYTDVHVVTAFFIAGCRLGINLGELIDFLLGWSGADIIGDDL